MTCVRKGFTLIELLLSIGIIAALAAIVIMAINPTRQFAQTRNAQRRSDIKAILEATQQYALDHAGILPTGIDGTWRMIGTEGAGCDVACGQSGMVQVIGYATADAYLSQAVPATNYGSATQIQEYPWTPSWTKRGIIQFDFSSIPTTATITSAQLFLHEATTYGSTRTVALHRVTRDWTEAGVTWNRTDGTTNWTTPGGEYAGTASATASVVWTGVLDWDSWNVQTDVQNFVSGVQTNYGWIIKDASEDSSQAYWYFDSDETGASAYRPYLQVNYSSVSDDGGITAASCLDLSQSLTSTYLPTLPADPRTGSWAKTFYALRASLGRLTVRACSTELDENIVVKR